MKWIGMMKFKVNNDLKVTFYQQFIGQKEV